MRIGDQGGAVSLAADVHRIVGDEQQSRPDDVGAGLESEQDDRRLHQGQQHHRNPGAPGDPGSPTINLPFPPGWQDAGNRTPAWAYAAILFSDPAMAQDPPTIIALVSRLTGNVDPAKILEFAPGEIKNLPGYEGAEEGNPSTLGGFDATQIGGGYTKDGVKRVIAQKTVVIPGQDGLYVLQLNADGTEDQMGPLMDATSVIDEQTTITP